MFLTELKNEERFSSPLREETLIQKKFKKEEEVESKPDPIPSKAPPIKKPQKLPLKNLAQTTSQKFTSKENGKSTFPSINKSRASTSAIAQREGKRFDNLKTLMGECKSAKKPIESDNRNPLVTFYESKIVQFALLFRNYDTIYKSGNPNKIMKELKRIEKRKFLEQELDFKQTEMERVKSQLNNLQYEIKGKNSHLKSLKLNLERMLLQIQEEMNEMTADELKEEENNLLNELESMKFTVDSLSFVHTSRKNLVLQIKKMCSEHHENLHFVETRTNFFSNLTEKRKLKCEEYSKKLSKYSLSLSPQLLGPRFSEMLEDELSVFEEARAVKEIFRHEHEIEVENERIVNQEKKANFQKQKVLKEKAQERIRREKRREEELLKDLKVSFGKIRKVTNVMDISELPEHKLNLELGQKFFEGLLSNLAKEVESKKAENQNLTQIFHSLLHDNPQGSSKEDEEKMDQLEKIIIFKHNHVSELENSNGKLKKLISDICVATARILYQMQKDVLCFNSENPRQGSKNFKCRFMFVFDGLET